MEIAEHTRKITKQATQTRGIQCTGCIEYFLPERGLVTTCNHGYCKQCVYHLLKIAMSDISYFPPRCCKEPIFPEKLYYGLPLKLVEEYKKRLKEFYAKTTCSCSSRSCSLPLHSNKIKRGVGKCPLCKQRTCINCRREARKGECESINEDDEKPLELARDLGWQKCSACWSVVEKIGGCNHTT